MAPGGHGGATDSATLSIQRAAADAPDTPALITPTTRLTFGELADAAVRDAATLASYGIGRTGAALTPAGDLESVVRLWALAESGIPILLLHGRDPERVRAATCRAAPGFDRVDRLPRAEPDGPRAQLDVPPDDERPLVLVRTSGTTGAPRCVVLSRRAVAASAAASARRLGWHPADRWLVTLPLSHVGGLSILTRCVAARRTAVLLPGFDAAETASALERERVTLVSLVPTMLERLLRLPGWSPPASLRAVVLGGAAAPARLLDESRRRGLPVVTTYGLTEAASQVATAEPSSPPHPDIGAGRPLDGVEVRIRDGRIEIRGPVLASGLYPPVSGERFVDEDGWFRTADLGRLDDAGRLHVLGRADGAILSGGELVWPERVEESLRQLPDVRDAAIAGIADPDWGEVVAAVLVVEPPGRHDARSIREALGERLRPAERPRRILCLAEDLPRTASGKVDRAALGRLLAERLGGAHGESRP